MNNDELWEVCKEYMEHWESTTIEQKQELMKTLEKIKADNLESLGIAMNRARIIDTLIAVLNNRNKNDVEPVPDIYIKAFGELKQ